MSSDAPALAGQTALGEGRWTDARDAFEAALAQDATPVALDGLAEALWWLGESRRSASVCQSAYVAYQRAGRNGEAALAAMRLCVMYKSNFGNVGAARGWLARADRLLAGTVRSPAHAWVESTRAWLTADVALNERVLRDARAAGDIDLELCSLAGLGKALVVSGRLDEGLALVDEAMVATLAGEPYRLDTVVYACCDMLVACHEAADLERATRWCQVADEFVDRYGCPFLFAECRTPYGAVLVQAGRWQQAEVELTAAARMAGAAAPSVQSEALVRLADLRLRQGRLEEAETFLTECPSERATLMTAAALRLARGEPAVTAELLDRLLRARGRVAGVEVPAWELLVEARLALGDVAGAEAAVSRLASIPACRGTVASGRAAFARGLVAAARARVTDAAEAFAQAVDAFEGLPFEAARARHQRARTLADDKPEVALDEARRALDAFDRLGATADADATAALLRRLGAGSRPGPRAGGRLTGREREVLTLVGLGLSNPEIAERLYISRKTASHHVSRVLAKLGVPNRASAAAQARRVLDDESR